MKLNPLGLVMLGGAIFWASTICLWWTRGLYVGTAIMLGVLMAIGGIIVIAAGIVDFRKPRWYKCSWCRWYFSSEGHIVPELKLTDLEPDELVSHGTCPACARMFRESEKMK